MTTAESGRRDALETAEEIRLVIRARRGDHRSFEALVDRYMGKSVMIAVSYVRNRDDALELAQEAFYRVFKALDSFREGEPFAPWFYRILRNTCLNFLEKRRLRRTTSIHGHGEDEGDLPLPAGCLQPHEAAVGGETRRQFWLALEQLPQKHREILLLRHFDELDYQSIADVLQIPIGTVMSRLFHARQKLRNLMSDYMEGRR